MLEPRAEGLPAAVKLEELDAPEDADSLEMLFPAEFEEDWLEAWGAATPPPTSRACEAELEDVLVEAASPFATAPEEFADELVAALPEKSADGPVRDAARCADGCKEKAVPAPTTSSASSRPTDAPPMNPPVLMPCIHYLSALLNPNI